MYLNKVKHFFVLAIAVFMFACSSGSGPEKVAEKYVSAMINGDIETFMAVVHLTEEEKQQFNMMKGKMSEMLKAAAAAAELAGGVKSIKSTSTNYSGDKKTASVSVKLEFKNGTSDEESVNLISTKDGWKVKL